MRIDGLDKAELLIALYNYAVQVPGLRVFGSLPLTIDEVKDVVKSGRKNFDFWYGRAMKVTLDSDELDTNGYNSVNGAGKAEEVIESLRKKIT